jgi:hypothetical protein
LCYHNWSHQAFTTRNLYRKTCLSNTTLSQIPNLQRHLNFCIFLNCYFTSDVTGEPSTKRNFLYFRSLLYVNHWQVSNPQPLWVTTHNPYQCHYNMRTHNPFVYQNTGKNITSIELREQSQFSATPTCYTDVLHRRATPTCYTNMLHKYSSAEFNITSN